MGWTAMNGSREEQLPLIDSHIHLDRYEPEHVGRMLAEAFRSGLQGAVAVSMGLESVYIRGSWRSAIPAKCCRPMAGIPSSRCRRSMRSMRCWTGSAAVMTRASGLRSARWDCPITRGRNAGQRRGIP